MRVGILFCAILFFGFCSVSYAGCWKADEVARLGFDELSDEIVLSFKDAVDCVPLINADVELLDEQFRTDSFGYISLPIEIFEDFDDNVLSLRVKKESYIPLHAPLKVIIGSVWNQFFLLTKKISIHQTRFVLQWGKNPVDLDLHLRSEDFHISYRHKSSVAAKARLDRDARKGIGPETITLEKIDQNKTYKVFVHHYAGRGKIDPHAMLSVYKNNRLDKTILLPNTSERYVNMLTITGNHITYLNQPASAGF